MCDVLTTPEHYRLASAPYLSWRNRAATYRRLSRRHPLIYPQAAFGREDPILASKPSDSQDEMPQGAYPSNPNATGECKSGWYKPYTTGTFDDNYDQDGGLGQITTKINDGYPFKDGDVLKMKGTT